MHERVSDRGSTGAVVIGGVLCPRDPRPWLGRADGISDSFPRSHVG